MNPNDSRGHWDPALLSSILSSSTISEAMIELRTSCGFKSLVHKSLLSHYSRYYSVAVNGKFLEAKNTFFELELNKQQAEIFICWLYSGRLSDNLLRPDTKDLLDLYVFADKTDISALRRQIITALVNRRGVHMSLRSIIMIVNSVPGTSPLYRFAVEWYVHHWLPRKAENGRYDPDYEELPKEFLFTVMCGFSEIRDNHQRMKRILCKCCTNPCYYHEHESQDDWVASCATFGDVCRMERHYD
ncbi:hypothetical protein KCU77_g4103, partial [Aureobasidium melanogenum]